MKAISALAVTLSFAVALPGHRDSRPTEPPVPRFAEHPVLPPPVLPPPVLPHSVLPLQVLPHSVLPLAVLSPPVAPPVAHRTGAPPASRLAPAELNAVVKQYCQKCHNSSMRRGNLSLVDFDVGAPDANAAVAEKVVAKLRAGMMPPVGSKRPSADTLNALATSLEQQLDASALAHPNPGRRTFQRLNRAEYRLAIADLLKLEVDATAYLPPDTKSDNFDNIADVQALSPMLLSAYLRAASDLSRLAIGNEGATAASNTYTMPRMASQRNHVEGTPFGTRGGMAVRHTFPADGEYRFDVNFFHETTGAFAGGLARGEQIEISVDGERVALLGVDRFMNASDPNGVAMGTERVRITAGPHRIAAAFVPPAFQGVVQDLISPLKWSLTSTSNAVAYGFSLLPHLREFTVNGPYAVTGVSETPMRKHIFSCRPATVTAERPCALSIVNRLGTMAYRRPLTDEDRAGLMSLYDSGRKDGDFETGVQTALEAILASPDFVFRFERAPLDVAAGANYTLPDIELASRLSFFLWSALPDQALLAAAAGGTLSEPGGLEREVRRMLDDPRAKALSTRFAAQWLRLPDLDIVQPDVRQYPDFDEQLRDAMRQETELFFDDLVRRDRPLLDLYSADYTFVNERLAQHYNIPNVVGPQFRRVKYLEAGRRGVLSHASVLTLTSHAGRTSAVERGKWVMEVMLNSPPPPPPPGVPDLEATPESAAGRLLTVRERMEQHRKSPSCASCHKMMDPIGLAMEQYDVTGRLRLRDNGMPIDSRGDLWDGTTASTVAELQQALLRREDALLRTFTRNLMAYAIGRRIEAYDMPTVRSIVRDAATQDHRMSAYILGVVRSPAFRMQRAEGAVPKATEASSGASSSSSSSSR